MKITDAHVHYSPQAGPEFLTAFLDRTGTDCAVIQAVSHSRCISLVPGALLMKDRNPDRFYVFGSPDLSGYYLDAGRIGEHQAEYVARLLAAGCDGVKLLEGKPQMRKTVPIPDFDLPCWEPFWSYAENEAVPILWHVNDPETNWCSDPSPWLKRQGWWYDETFINNEVQYSQVFRVLERHPNLKIVFAHFLFFSAQLDRLDNLMSRYPNLMVDLTPGIEMYENFSANLDRTGAFFEKYYDRIAYGTDIGGRCVLTNEGEAFNEKENLLRPRIVQRFLTMKGKETISADGEFLHDRAPFVMRGLGLSGSRVEDIMNGNIRSFIGGDPKPVDAEETLMLCACLREKLAEMASHDESFHPDASEIDMAERYFSKKVYGD